MRAETHPRSPHPRAPQKVTTTSLTVAVESVRGRLAMQADARCTRCGRAITVPEGVYVVRLHAEEDDGLRGSIRRIPDGREWSFSSGAEFAGLVCELGHGHEDQDEA